MTGYPQPPSDGQRVNRRSSPEHVRRAAPHEALFGHLRQWVGEEEYWLLHAHGRGDFDATLETADGRFALFIPLGMDPERDSFEISEDGKRIRWVAYPGAADGGDGTKSLYFQLSNPNAPVRVSFKHNGASDPALDLQLGY